MTETKTERLQVRITPSLKKDTEDSEVLKANGVKSRGELVCKLLAEAVRKVKGNQATTG